MWMRRLTVFRTPPWPDPLTPSPFDSSAKLRKKRALRNKPSSRISDILIYTRTRKTARKSKRNSKDCTRKGKKRRETSELSVVAGAGLERPPATSQKPLVRYRDLP